MTERKASTRPARWQSTEAVEAKSGSLDADTPSGAHGRKAQSSRPEAMARVVEVLSLAILCPAAVLLGIWLGGGLGGFAGWSTAGSVVGATIGGVAAFYELVRRARGGR